MPLRALLDQFAPNFPGFCKVGMGHNKKIDFDAKGFIAVTDSVPLLRKLKFDSIFVDEGHHPLPSKMPQPKELYLFSATHKEEPDFRYTMGQAIEDGVLCDYDITVPALTAHHAYVCLADLLLKQVGRFRRVLAYCSSIAESKRFRKAASCPCAAEPRALIHQSAKIGQKDRWIGVMRADGDVLASHFGAAMII